MTPYLNFHETYIFKVVLQSYEVHVETIFPSSFVCVFNVSLRLHYKKKTRKIHATQENQSIAFTSQ